jgi:hypothetical protein
MIVAVSPVGWIGLLRRAFYAEARKQGRGLIESTLNRDLDTLYQVIVEETKVCFTLRDNHSC